MKGEAHFDPAQLTLQAEWLRRLARSLLNQGDEDIAQQTWLEAFARPPRTGVTRA